MRLSDYQTVLITGGAGFIGSHIAEGLLAKGHNVHIFDNLSTGKIENLSLIKDKVKLIQGDIRDLKAVTKACDGTDCIIHHAAQISVQKSIGNPKETSDIDALGTLNILQAAKSNKTKKIIYASSSAVYGDTDNVPTKEDVQLKPLSPYGFSKAIGEYYCQVFSYLFNINIIIFRYFNVFGARQDPNSEYSGVIAKFTNMAKKNENICICGDGMQTRDFVSVSKIKEANLLAVDKEFQGCKILNVGSGHDITIKELADRIIKIYKSKSNINYGRKREGDIQRSCADIDNIKANLSWDEKFNLEQELMTIS